MNENRTNQAEATPGRLIESNPGKLGTPGRNPRKRYAWTKYNHRDHPAGSGHARRAARWARQL